MLRFMGILTKLLLFALMASKAHAVNLIRDADIEASLSRLAAPVLTQAGLHPNSVRILVVNDDRLNAFVLDHRHIFINAGLMEKMQSADMLIAVIAHEAAHIANGHIERRQNNVQNASSTMAFGLLLALAAGAASNRPELAAGVSSLATNATIRNFLAHTRAEEASADQTAFRIIRGIGADPKGAVDVFEIFKGQEYLQGGRVDPYVQSHPLTRDRLRAAKRFAQSGKKYSVFGDPNADYDFARAKTKLSAFTRRPAWNINRAETDEHADLRHMRLAVAYANQGDLGTAISHLNRLRDLAPNDGYFQDLRAELYMRARQHQTAAREYTKAAEMLPRNALVRGGLGRALLATGNITAATDHLQRARDSDFRDASILRDLALAYAKQGKTGHAALATAERYALSGRSKDAKINATRAARLLPEGSSAWRRAQDILSITDKTD
jgi:predicted Zn-dependent protease